MSWITDIIKELRLLGVHKEKIALVEFKLSETEKSNVALESENLALRQEVSALKQENSSLKGSLSEAQINIQQLQAKTYKTKELYSSLPDELEDHLLITIGQQGGSCNEHDLKGHLGANLHERGKQQINQVALDRSLSKLKEKGYIESNEDTRSIYEQLIYSLTDKARDYLIDNKLL